MAGKKNDGGEGAETGAVDGSEVGYEMSKAVLPQATETEVETAIEHALREMKERGEEMVQLINLSMGPVTFWVPRGTGSAKCRVQACQLTPPMPKDFADRLLIRPKPTRFDPRKWTWHDLGRTEPPNHRPETFTDKTTGRTIPTSTYRPKDGVTLVNGSPMYHSVNQAQHFLARLTTPSAIRRFIREFDARPDVTLYASLVLDFRERARLERSGYGELEQTNAMF